MVALNILRPAMLLLLLLPAVPRLGLSKSQNAKAHGKLEPRFQTSDRCLACHNGLITPSGRDVSIGFNWRASLMANSSRDPYWQASVRKEALEHPQAKADVEDECSVCHMPITRYQAKLHGKPGEVFSHLPFDNDKEHGAEAQDGVNCSVCHQISKEGLGTRQSFNGGFVIDRPDAPNLHPEYGPFAIQGGNQKIMQSSTGGFHPNEDAHIRQAQLCATCHTLYTQARGKNGEVVGELPEQMPYLEWQASDYRDKQTCQDCHMPVVNEPTPISRVLGIPREGLHQHVFVASNFFMQGMLNRYRDELSVAALPQELQAGADGTIAYLKEKAARISIDRVNVAIGRLQAEVVVQNLGGHKLPTAYPSRRAWIHFVVRDRNHKIIFESGAEKADGSIEGNDNDADPARYEPHYMEITKPDQVQIFEAILQDPDGHVTTGLLSALSYLKDNRLLPAGFNKAGAGKDIAVHGGAADDPCFTDAGDRLTYSIATGAAVGPFQVDAELWYQPIGYRWASNLKRYNQAAEPNRFTTYFDSMASGAGVVLTHAQAIR